jgi:phage baseplate assembly protein W
MKTITTNIPEPKVMSWSLEGVSEDGRWHYAENDKSVREVIRNILLTRPGERLMRKQFGAGLLDFIHQPNNQTTRNVMAEIVRKAIDQWETRVQVEQVEVLPDRDNLSVVQIIIRYRMLYSGQINQLSFGIDLNQL